jgi:ferredoxin-like protein FixX
MPTFNCCENHSVTLVREEPANFFRGTPLGNGKREYHKCLSCGATHVLTKAEGGVLIDHRREGLKTSQ